MTSAAFERFRFSFFEDTDSARHGLDTVALARLEGEERARADDMLIGYLPDARGIIGLGVLRSRRAEPALLQLFEDEEREQRQSLRVSDSGWRPYLLIYLAKALWQIRPDPRWPTALTGVLAAAGDEMVRQEAAWTLSDVHDTAVVRPLANALDDPDDLVRHHAARSLLAIHGLSVASYDPQHMMYRVMSKDATRREGGKRDVLRAIAGRAISPP
jgi:hypothetical protein